MDRPGDSDRRLLDAMSALGLSPSWLATPAAWVDPWLAVGLVDLERQMARRNGQWERLVASEQRVLELLDGRPGEALAVLHAHDLGLLPR